MESLRVSVPCRPVGTVFPAAFAHFLALCHTSLILASFQTFLL